MGKETQRQTLDRHEWTIKELNERTKRIGQEVREANLRSREAHVGLIENSVRVGALKDAYENFRKDFDEMKKGFRSTRRWLVGVFFSAIGLILAIVGFIVKAA